MTNTTLPQKTSREPSEQVAGRVVGILVFLGGIAILVFAFVLAYKAFHNPELIVPLSVLRQNPPPSPASVYVPAALRLVLLFGIGYFGSLIAAQGAQFFLSARREERHEHRGD